MKQRFDVTGMSCTACSSHVERAVSALAGVSSVTVDLMQNRMLVEYDDSKLSEAEICRAVAAAGYGARPAGAAGGGGARLFHPISRGLHACHLIQKRELLLRRRQ